MSDESVRDDVVRAVDLALAGKWDEAHDVVQRHEGDATAAWVHAVLHKIEGDLSNSRYWYRQAGRPAAIDADSRDELRTIRAAVAG